MDRQMKLCKDCKHCRTPFWDWFFGMGRQFARCAHPRFKPSPVTGKKVYDEFCSSQRKGYEYVDTCGPDAKYFEHKGAVPFGPPKRNPPPYEPLADRWRNSCTPNHPDFGKPVDLPANTRLLQPIQTSEKREEKPKRKRKKK